MLKPLQQPEPEVDPVLLEKKRKKLEKAKQKKLARKQRALERKHKRQIDYLQREVKYGAYTFRKYQKEWMNLLTEITIARQKCELEYAWQNFENVLDIKDFIISRCMDEIQESEYQYRLNLMQFFNGTNGLITKFHEQLRELHDNYNKELQYLKDNHEEFLAEMNKTFEENMTHLKTMIYILDVQGKDFDMNLRAEFCAETELAIQNYEQTTMILRIKLEPTFDSLWKTTNDIFSDYERMRQAIGIEHDNLKAADDKMQELLSAELKKINRLCELIKKLRKKDENITLNNPDELTKKARFFRKVFLVLKQTLSADLNFDKWKQVLLITEFDTTFKEMQDILYCGENLLKLMRSCKKMETLGEKILPYPDETYSEDARNHKLLLFWQRIGMVESSRSALYEEKLYLKKENEFLNSKFKKICSCWGCPKLPPVNKDKNKSIRFYDTHSSLLEEVRNQRQLREMAVSENDV